MPSCERPELIGREQAHDRSDVTGPGPAHLNQLTIGYAAWNELADRVWELRHNMTPNDAAYLVLAEARGCRLVTTDGKLRDGAGRRCEVHVVTPGR